MIVHELGQYLERGTAVFTPKPRPFFSPAVLYPQTRIRETTVRSSLTLATASTSSARPFKHVTLMLYQLLRHMQQAKTAEDARLITLTIELERATAGLERLYQAVEEGALSIDDALRTRTQKLKARRSEAQIEMVKLMDRPALAVRRVDADAVKAFCSVLRERFNEPASSLKCRVILLKPAPAVLPAAIAAACDV